MSFADYITRSRGPMDFSRFKTVDESRYSCLMPWHVEQVRTIFKKEIPNAKVLEDRTAHIGCDAINFSDLYPKADIFAYEIDSKVAEILKQNIKAYRKTNIQVIVGDSSKLPLHESSDVVYLDPPWGGVDYKLEKKMHLFLGERPIAELIAEYLPQATVVLKGPTNLHEKDLEIPGAKIKTYLIRTASGKPSFNLHFIRKL